MIFTQTQIRRFKRNKLISFKATINTYFHYHSIRLDKLEYFYIDKLILLS